jgi:hypothetical protein
VKSDPYEITAYAGACFVVAALAMFLGQTLQPHSSPQSQLVLGLMMMFASGWTLAFVTEKFVAIFRGPRTPTETLPQKEVKPET